MSSNGSKPPQPHCRSWLQNDVDDNASYTASQRSAGPGLTQEDDNVSMTSAGDAETVDYADDEYDLGEEQEDHAEQGEDNHQPDGLGHNYTGVQFEAYASHVTYDGPYHQIPHSPAAGQTNSTYLGEESDVSDGGGGPIAPINYLSIANILTSDIDMEEAFDSAGDFAPFNEQHTLDYHQSPQQGDVDGILYGAPPAAAHWDDSGDIPPPQAASIAASQNSEGVQQQLDQIGPGDEFEDGSAVWFPVPAPPAFVSPNMSSLHPANYGLVEFLQQWSFTGARKSRMQGRFPWPQRVVDLSRTHLTHVQYADLAVDECDVQGIDWKDLRVTRRDARERRRLTYRNYTNQDGSDVPNVSHPDVPASTASGMSLTICRVRY